METSSWSTALRIPDKTPTIWPYRSSGEADTETAVIAVDQQIGDTLMVDSQTRRSKSYEITDKLKISLRIWRSWRQRYRDRFYMWYWIYNDGCIDFQCSLAFISIMTRNEAKAKVSNRILCDTFLPLLHPGNPSTLQQL